MTSASSPTTRTATSSDERHRHRQNSDMGLFGLASTATTAEPQALRRRHERPDPDARCRRASRRAATVLAGPASTGLAGDWMKAMWNDLVFDTAGNLYVPDDKPRSGGSARTARPRSGSPTAADRLLRLRRRPLGGRIDPTGQWLYVSITVSAEFPLESRHLPGPAGRPSDGGRPRAGPSLPVRPDARAAAGDGPRLREVRATSTSASRPEPDRGPRPDGNEIRRISDPLFHSPWGLAFSGKSLL
jgi:hypothetical protein